MEAFVAAAVIIFLIGSILVPIFFLMVVVAVIVTAIKHKPFETKEDTKDDEGGDP